MRTCTDHPGLEYAEAYLVAAKLGGPPDGMQGIEKADKKQFVKYKINDNPELWDLSVLINIFHDHFEHIFCKSRVFHHLSLLLRRRLPA